MAPASMPSTTHDFMPGSHHNPDDCDLQQMIVTRDNEKQSLCMFLCHFAAVVVSLEAKPCFGNIHEAIDVH